MIHTDKNGTRIEGNIIRILNDISNIANSFKKIDSLKKEDVKQLLACAIGLGLAEDEAESREWQERLSEKLFETAVEKNGNDL